MQSVCYLVQQWADLNAGVVKILGRYLKNRKILFFEEDFHFRNHLENRVGNSIKQPIDKTNRDYGWHKEHHHHTCKQNQNHHISDLAG